MLEESTEQDHFLGMIDKLHVMNLSMEGAAILASMADAIRTALEKGQILEQLIINQRTAALQNSCQEAPLKKKHKKKRKHSIDPEGADGCSLQSQETPHVEEQNMELDILSDRSIPETIPSKRNSDSRPENKLDSHHTIKVNHSTERTVPSNTNVIKVVSPAFINSSLNSTLNQNKLTNESVTLPNQYTLNPSTNYQSDNLSPYQYQYVCQPEDGRIRQNSCSYSLPQKRLSSSEPTTYDNKNLESQQQNSTVDKQKYHLNSFTSNVSHISKTSKIPSSHNESAPSEEPVMPFPIIIKSEYINPQPKPSISLKLDAADSSSVAEVSSSANRLEVSSSANRLEVSSSANRLEVSKDNEDNFGMVNDLDPPKPPYKVFMEAGKDATEDEIRAVLKDLNIVYCRIIYKPSYSFGFIDFSTAEHMKAALALSKKFVVGGKPMYIRPLHEQRSKRKRQPSPHDFTKSDQEHSEHSSPGKKIRSSSQTIREREEYKRSDSNTRTESTAFPRDNYRYQRDRHLQKFSRRNPVHHPHARSSYKKGGYSRKNHSRRN